MWKIQVIIFRDLASYYLVIKSGGTFPFHSALGEGRSFHVNMGCWHHDSAYILYVISWNDAYVCEFRIDVALIVQN